MFALKLACHYFISQITFLKRPFIDNGTCQSRSKFSCFSIWKLSLFMNYYYSVTITGDE